MKSPHRVILASAGTGKTFQLTSRYLSLVAAGCDPSTILATTFTRKAAGEILNRILGRLVLASTDAKSLRELQEHVGGGLTAQRCAALTAMLARKIHRLNVGTIDAFFGTVLRAFGLDLGIPPGWEMIDDQADDRLRMLAIRRVLASPSLSRADAATLLNMLRGGSPGVGVYESLLRSVNEAYGAFQQAGRPEVWEVFGPASAPPDEAEVERLIRTVHEIEAPLTGAKKPHQSWAKAIGKLEGGLSNGDWLGLVQSGLVKRLVDGDPKYYNIEFSPAAHAAISQVSDAATRVLLQRLKDRNVALRDLLSRFDQAYQDLKASQGWMRFDDVPRLLSSSTDQLDDLYFRLDGRIDHLLLDEFQDTSLDQFRILRPIMEELVSQGDEHESRSVLCVGDVKQSLYSWRGAEPELLPGLCKLWPQLEPVGLNENRRSSPAILEAVNAVFELIASNSALEEQGSAAAARIGGSFVRHVAHQTDVPGLARLIVAPAIEATEPEEDEAAVAPAPDKVSARARFVAQRVREIRKQSPQATIAVLTRTNAMIARIIFELREADIPAVGERGNPLTDSPAASVAISALHLADHPGDSAAAFHVATSPLGKELGLSIDNGESGGVASRLRARIAKGGIAGLLRWMQRRLVASMHELGFARFDQLVDLAEEFDAKGGPISEFVHLARSRAVEPPSGFGRDVPVRVMTVHAAKGLEFDAVVLPELDKKWGVRPGTILVDRQGEDGVPDPLSPVSAITSYPESDVQALHAPLRALFRRTLDRTIGEELCGLYVAMTRAKRYLEMIVSPSGATNDAAPTAAKVLCQALAKGKDLVEGQTLYQFSSGVVWYEGMKPQEPVNILPSVSLRLGTAVLLPSGRLRRRSPSSLEGGARIDLGELWRSGRAESGPGAAARKRGTAFHAMFEEVEWLDDAMPDEAKLLQVAAVAEFSDANLWVQQFLGMLRGPAGESLKRARYASRGGTVQVRREWHFAVREHPDGEEPLILDGQFDRVVYGVEAGRAIWAEVVDFKTDDVAAGNSALISERIEFYRPQIEAYKRAAALLLRLKPEAVTAALVFSGPGQVVSV